MNTALLIAIIIALNFLGLYDLCRLYDAALRRSNGYGIKEFTRRRNNGIDQMADVNSIEKSTTERIREIIDVILCFPVMIFTLALGKVLKQFVPGT